LIYDVRFDKKSAEFLDKLDIATRTRIISRIEASLESPYHFFERLTGVSGYRLRVGDYRVIADIDDSESRILIRVVGHRRNVYDHL
jgi:mRNA interferase RelE/StbE